MKIFQFLCTNLDDDAPGPIWRKVAAPDLPAARAAVEAHHATLTGSPVILDEYEPGQLVALAAEMSGDETPADLTA
jgi:hypothetical protein